MKKIKISIGICAYNEQKKIGKVISDILSQSRDNWELVELLVYSDGSTDNTVTEVKKIDNHLINVISDEKRLGKTKRLQQMFQKFSGEILVMFDADILLNNTDVINNLIMPFTTQSNVMLVGGNSRPHKPASFFERSVFTTFSVFYKSRKLVRGGNNIFGCTGSVLAIKDELAKHITLPDIVNEDSYLYLSCIAKGFEFKYVDEAIVEYQLPKNLGDYLRQVFRSEPTSVTLELKKYFGPLAQRELSRPLKFYVRSIVEVFFAHPSEVIFITLVNLLCKPLIPLVIRNYDLSWFTAKSTH